MPEALAKVKQELGADAVILGTRSLASGRIGRLVGQNQVEITAAPADTPAHTPRPTSGGRPRPTQPRYAPAVNGGVAPRAHSSTPSQAADADVPAAAYPFYVELVQREVGRELAARLVREAAEAVRQGGNTRPDALEKTVRAAIARMVPTAGGIDLSDGSGRRVALIGAAGGGKTTTLAKLAAHFKLREKRRVAIVSLDMHRMATNDQLRRYAEIIGVPMYAAQTVRGTRETFARLRGMDLVLIDTPGMGLWDRGRFARLGALLRAARTDEVHLVLPVYVDAAIQRRTAEAFAPLGVSRVVLTRLDEAVGLGVVLNALEHLEWSVSYFTDGQKVPNDIQEACGSRVAELVFETAN